jgi:hypothetical protein
MENHWEGRRHRNGVSPGGPRREGQSKTANSFEFWGKETAIWTTLGKAVFRGDLGTVPLCDVTGKPLLHLLKKHLLIYVTIRHFCSQIGGFLFPF